jgi:glycine betaine catabolism B
MTGMLIAPVAGPSWAPSCPAGRLDELDDTLTCTDVTVVTHDVKSFTFGLPAPLHFLPGQYLTVGLFVDGKPVERCYTISSPPSRSAELTITVKRAPGGPVSNWLHDNLRMGDSIRATGPLGRFSYAHHPAEKYLFLTAGSGITPAMSMVRTLCADGHGADVVLVHCARTPDDIIFRAELEALDSRLDVRVAVLCEGDSPTEPWHGRRGRLVAETLFDAAPDLPERETFTCGPPPFMEAVRSLLDRAGADAGRRHEESFTLGDGPAPAVGGAAAPAAGDAAATQATPGGTTYTLGFRRSGRSVECDAGTTVLDAAARAGLSLPSSCGEGVCGTCKLTVLSGQVDMQHAGGIRPREVARQKILACCSTPLEDLVLDA